MRPIIPVVLIAFMGMCLPLHDTVSPVHASLTLDTSIAAGEFYTNNLFFTFADKRDDFGTFVTPRVTLAYASQYLVAAGTYSGTAQFYANHPGANTYTNGANFNFDLPFLTKRYDQLEVKLNESFNITPQLPAFTSISDDQSFGANLGPGGGGGFGGFGGGGGGLGGASLSNQGVITGRGTTTYQNRAGFTATYRFSPIFSQSLDYSHIIQKSTSSQFQDSTRHRVRAQVERRINPRLAFNLRYTFQRINFDGGGAFTTQAPGGRGEGTSHAGTVGMTYQVSPTIPVSFRGGLAYSKTETRADRINFTGNAQISKIYSDGRATLSYRQRIGSGGGVAAATTLSQTVFLSANKLMTQYVSVFGSFGYGRNTSLSGPAVQLNTYQGNVGVSVVLLSWLSGVGSYSYQNQDSSGTFGNTAQSNNFFVGVSATAPPWRIFK